MSNIIKKTASVRSVPIVSEQPSELDRTCIHLYDVTLPVVSDKDFMTLAPAEQRVDSKTYFAFVTENGKVYISSNLTINKLYISVKYQDKYPRHPTTRQDMIYGKNTFGISIKNNQWVALVPKECDKNLYNNKDAKMARYDSINRGAAIVTLMLVFWYVIQMVSDIKDNNSLVEGGSKAVLLLVVSKLLLSQTEKSKLSTSQPMPDEVKTYLKPYFKKQA
jgi:hypothetical protein